MISFNISLKGCFLPNSFADEKTLILKPQGRNYNYIDRSAPDLGRAVDEKIILARLTDVEDCPSVSLKFRTDQAITWTQAEMAVTRSINPFGKCCKGEIVIIDHFNN